ncbi:RNA-binding protein 45 isoform X2 [Contarinia nasturtii]|nr:RNA-binding protein 45 isoform X2 [Contarinia nasturtii]XP_031632618.1 RNA-binding protein 45 isoform X2 [Contarinia nasturtii]
MSNRRNEDNSRNNGIANSDDPPMSRLFIICNKQNTEEDFREAFQKFGKIEEIYTIKDRSTGDNKGVVYIKFNKTSEAAKALEEMNGKTLGTPPGSRPLKVLVASSRNQGSGRTENEHEKYVRLFVIVPKNMTEEDLRSEFEEYGPLESVSMIRDKVTRECKGFAYVKFFKFTHAALAYEGVGGKYRAVFAEPKGSSKTSNSNSSDRGSSRHDDYSMTSPYGGSTSGGSTNNIFGNSHGNRLDYSTFLNNPVTPNKNNFNASSGINGNSSEVQLNVIVNSTVNQDQLWRLFDIVPGLEYCHITGECSRNSNYATAAYNSIDAAQYAREKIHGLEYPPGQRIIIKAINCTTKPEAENIFAFESFQSSKEPFSSVALPAPAPLANPTSQCAQRCFIVCVPKALPPKILNNVFSRFGDLIDVYLLPNKNCGYAKYASESSAMKAIEVLHSAEICGVKLKVMEAEEPRDAKRKRYDD